MSIPQDIREGSDLQSGTMVPGKGIFIGDFDLFDVRRQSLGILTRWYDVALELGKPKTFNDTADAVANCNVNGRGGLYLNPERYEAELFEKLKTGEALAKNVIPPLEVVKAIYALRDKGEYKRLSDRDLPGELITTASGTDFAHCQWSCTCRPNGPDDVRAVDFTVGNDGWVSRGNSRLSGRACFAELAL